MQSTEEGGVTLPTAFEYTGDATQIRSEPEEPHDEGPMGQQVTATDGTEHNVAGKALVMPERFCRYCVT